MSIQAVILQLKGKIGFHMFVQSRKVIRSPPDFLDTRELGNSAGGDVIDLSSAPVFQPLNGLVGSRTRAAFRQPTDIL